ncbi:hypothetical protein NDU88_004260 [Pleurodeles waltl]|uniref:Uncharacterized protein n=1 Tax=Pleurodeles waltl TaxID=8319 RepID=A0AAV7NJB2_PLEWA|nr:hypothetical protein NDU88_004260 [Pleurodeles waltl]
MGKRNAADLPVPLNDTKKQKKHPRKLANKAIGCGPKSLDKIGLLFEEAEAILNSEMVINGALPSKKALLQPRRIQEFFNKKKKKGQTSDSVIQTDGGGNPSHTNDTIHFSSQGTVGSATNSSPRQGVSQVEVVASIPFPLSPEIRLVPNILCRNRFGPLAEEGDLLRVHEHPMVEPDIEDAILSSIPITTTYSEQPISEASVSLILQRIDKVRNLVSQLAKFLQGKTVYPCECKWQLAEVVGKGGITMVERIPSTTTVQGDQPIPLKVQVYIWLI